MGESLLSDLRRKARKTAKSRFVAAQRLNLHNRLTQWTVTFASVALLLIPLLQAFGVSVSYTGQQLNVVQVILAVLLLVFSLLLGFEDFGVKAHLMHRCGTELNNLAKETEAYDAGDVEAYSSLLVRYNNVLERYENHKQIDFQMQQLQNPGDNFTSGWRHSLAKLWIIPKYYLQFFLYVIISLLVGGGLLSIFVFPIPT